MKTCQRCGRSDRPVGPWKGKEGSPLCGPCKLEIALTPDRLNKIAEEIRTVLKIVEGS